MIYDDAAIAEFANQRRLRDFRFPVGARFELDRAPDFSAMGYLQFLSLANSDLPSGFLSALAQVPILRRLDLQDCRFDKSDLRAFCLARRSPKFSELWLANTNIDDDDLEFIAQIASLEGLILTGTQVSDDGLPQLLNLRKLRTVMLGKTRVSPEAMLILARLPGLSNVALTKSDERDFLVAHLAHHKSSRPVDAGARDAAQQVLFEWMREMHNWEVDLFQQDSAIRKRYAGSRTIFNEGAPGESDENSVLMERATRQRADIIERFCTAKLAAKVEANIVCYGNPPQFDGDAEEWVDVEQKSANSLIFYSLSGGSRWRRFAMKRREDWRLDEAQIFRGKWERDFY